VSAAAPDFDADGVRMSWARQSEINREHDRWVRQRWIDAGTLVPADPNAPDRRGDRIVAALGLRVLTLDGPSPTPVPRRPVELPEGDPWTACQLVYFDRNHAR